MFKYYLSRSFCNEIARNSKYVISDLRSKLISARKSSSSTSTHTYKHSPKTLVILVSLLSRLFF